MSAPNDSNPQRPGSERPPSLGRPPRPGRSMARNVWIRLGVVAAVIVVVFIVLTAIPLGTANRVRTTSFDYHLAVEPSGTTFEISGNVAHLCEQARSDANLSAVRSFLLTWSTTGGVELSHLELVSVAVFPWTIFYDVSNASTGDYAVNATAELGVVCAPALELIATAAPSAELNFHLMLECAYTVGVPIL